MNAMSSTTVKIRRVRPVAVALWVAQALLALQFAIGGAAKLAGSQTMVDMFAEIGAGQWLRFLVGALELAAAIGLLMSRWCGPAALGLVGLMAGAVLTNAFVLGDSPLLPLAFAVVALMIAWGRRDEIRELLRKGFAR